jgi:hypothetical protein
MKRMCFISLLIAFTLGVNAQKKYDIAAYVWPAYFNEPRYASDLHLFLDGKGEWEAIYKTKPKFEGHRQPRVPLWGYLDQSDPKTQEKCINTALKYGVNTFIFDWYWYENKPFLEGVLNDGFLKAKNNEKMKFYIMWANHDATSYWDPNNPDKSKIYWQGAVSREVFDGFIDHLVNDYFKKPNYYKIDGKPVFAIYEVSTFINGIGGEKQAKEALDALRKKCVDAGFPGLHLQAILWRKLPEGLSGVPGDQTKTQDNTIRYLGFESLTNYQWCHFVPADQEYQSWGDKATAMYKEFGADFSIPYFPHVSTDWDPNSRFAEGSEPCVTGNTPAKFEKFLRKAKDYVDAHPEQLPLITINSWNEWSEGSYLEPDTDFKYGFLEAVKKVFKGK